MRNKALDVPVFEAFISARNESDLYKQSQDIIRELRPEWLVDGIEFKVWYIQKLTFRLVHDTKRHLNNRLLPRDFCENVGLSSQF